MRSMLAGRCCNSPVVKKAITGRALLVGTVIGSGGIYGLSLVVALWAAYDRWLALPRFGLLSGGMLFLAFFVGHTNAKGRERTSWLATGDSMLAGSLGLFFLLTHDWQATGATDFQTLSAVTTWVQGSRPTWGQASWLAPMRAHENAVAGALLLLLPLGCASCGVQWQRSHFVRSAIEGGALTVAIVALLLTFSRSAWVGLTVAAIVTGLTTIMPTRWPGFWTFLCSTLLLSLAVVTFVINPEFLSTVVRWLGWNDIGGAIGSRFTVWQNAVTIVPDYWFTGSGLQSTAMVLASYVYLLHVPYLAHGHNLYLQLALEQGTPALLAFAMGVAGLFWLSRLQVAEQPLVFGATIGLFALLIYGWFDAELYSSALAPLLFLPIAYLAHVALPAPQPPPVGPLLAGAMLPALTILLLAGFIGLPALFTVNQAAFEQTRAELSRYQWPAWPLQDAVRQALPAEFVAITARYRTVLRQEPDNVSAHRRLGQILLSQNDVTGAEHHLTMAYHLAPDQRVTRQLLGEVYALQGRVEAAKQMWQGVDLSQGQLTLRFQWYAEAGKFRESLQLARAAKTVAATIE